MKLTHRRSIIVVAFFLFVLPNLVRRAVISKMLGLRLGLVLLQ